MKQQTIMCLSAQTHAGWMGTGKYYYCRKESKYGLKILQDWNTLIEQSAKALINSSNKIYLNPHINQAKFFDACRSFHTYYAMQYIERYVRTNHRHWNHKINNYELIPITIRQYACASHACLTSYGGVYP